MELLTRSARIPQKTLAVICRSLSTMLHSGVDVQHAFDMTANKLSHGAAKRALNAVQQEIRRRGEIAPAMRAEGAAFPNLMIDLVAVGEQTGKLPEVFDSLSRHYETSVRLKREFLSSIAWPMFQLVAAILVIALLIYVLGFIQSANPDASGGFHFDIFGLTGTSGAMTWLVLTFGTLAGLYAAWRVAERSLAGKQFLDPLLMRVPVLGNCMRAFAIARFSWAFALTQQAGMGIRESLESSLRATDNGAFLMARPVIWDRLRRGDELADALAVSGLFPEDYIHTVHVAESSGTVPEALDRLSPRFEDEARRTLKMLTAALGWGIWALVAAFIIYIIFTVALQYVGMINDAASGNF